MMTLAMRKRLMRIPTMMRVRRNMTEDDIEDDAGDEGEHRRGYRR